MRPITLMQWGGAAIAAAGTVLMARSGPLSPAWTGTNWPGGSALHVNWLLLSGMAIIVGGGLLMQIASEMRHG